jgi:hypothetical protein
VPALAPARAWMVVNRSYQLALLGDAKDALKGLDLVGPLAKEANLPAQQLGYVERNVQMIRIHAARKLGRGADAEKAYAALLAEMQKEPMHAWDKTALNYHQGLVALAKKDAKAAVESLGKCVPDDRSCHFALVDARRAAGDKKGAAELLAQQKAAPRRDGEYLFFYTRAK